MKNKSTLARLRSLWPYVRKHSGLVAGMVTLTTLQVVANLGISKGMGLALDAGVDSNLNLFKQGILWVAVCWVVLDVAFYARLIMNGALGERVCHALRLAASRHLNIARYEELRAVHSGDYVSRLSNDLGLIRGLLAQELQFFIRAPIQCALTLTYMLLISWKLTLLSLAVLPILISLSNKVSQPISGQSQLAQKEMAQITALSQDAANGIVVTKAFSLRGALTERFRIVNQRYRAAQVTVAGRQGRLNAVAFLFNMGPLLILFGLGGYEIIAGRLTLGSVIVLLNLLGNLAWPLQSAAQSYGRVQAASAALERVMEIFSLSTEPVNSWVGCGGDNEIALELADVEYAYSNSQPVLRQLDLTVKRGETVAIVGHSGSGKSTLLQLLLGLIVPQSGTVKVFGSQLSLSELSSLRSCFSYVSQDNTLFAKSVRENIRLGRPEACDEEVEEAARKAFVHEFAEGLPLGYDTVLGEDGVGLSGGQKQRVSIARAILHDAPIMLLDEATSALDTESEARIHEAIESMRGQKTMLIVAHRLSTIRSADRIVVLHEGKIAEEGSHDELLQRGGIYSALHRQQSDNTSTAAASN